MPSKIVKGIRNPKRALSFVRNKINRKVGKVLYNVDQGMEKVKDARATIKILKTHDPDLDRKNFRNNKVEEFCKNGYSKLGNLFEPELMQKIAKKNNQMMENEKYSIIRSQENGQVYSRMLNRCLNSIPEIKEIINKEIIDILAEYYGNNFKVKDIIIWRNYHIPIETKEKEIYSNYWHNDDQEDWYAEDGTDMKPTKIFIVLNDIDEENGPLHIQSKSRSRELIDLGFKSRYEYKLPMEIIEGHNHVVKHIGSPGTAIWVNTRRCFHRAGNPTKGKIRDLIQINFIKSERPFGNDWSQYIEDSAVELRVDRMKNQ